MLAMQFGGLSAEIFYEIRLTEIPAEDYYTCEAALYMDHSGLSDLNL
jgi:hypothetical protein